MERESPSIVCVGADNSVSLAMPHLAPIAGQQYLDAFLQEGNVDQSRDESENPNICNKDTDAVNNEGPL